MPTPPVIVSSCLAGLPARYNGTVQLHPYVLELLRQGRALPVCPEQLAGLPTPREPIELLEGRVLSHSGEDLTEALHRGVAAVVQLAERTGARRAILQPRSPSCGVGRIYDGSFTGTLIPGDGLLALALKKAGLDVVSIDDLQPG